MIVSNYNLTHTIKEKKREKKKKEIKRKYIKEKARKTKKRENKEMNRCYTITRGAHMPGA